MDNGDRQAPCVYFSDESHQLKLYPMFLSHLPSQVYCFAETSTVATAAVDIITINVSI